MKKYNVYTVICTISCTILLTLSGCGQTGMQGLPGLPGQAGQDGVSGKNGHDGEDGANGSNGVGCTVSQVAANAAAPNGGALITCSSSSTLVLSGTNGANGVDSAAFEAIQLCPSTFVPSYPNVFPEVAFRLAGKLYAVYSTNGGFLTELTPGTYTSNGIGAICTFTVDSNLNIQ